MHAKLKLFGALSISCLMGGCGTLTSVTDTSCSSFKPIRGSTLDTPATKRQVVAHNQVFDTICH